MGGGGGGLKYFNFSPARWVRGEKPFSLNQVQVRGSLLRRGLFRARVETKKGTRESEINKRSAGNDGNGEDRKGAFLALPAVPCALFFFILVFLFLCLRRSLSGGEKLRVYEKQTKLIAGLTLWQMVYLFGPIFQLVPASLLQGQSYNKK